MKTKPAPRRATARKPAPLWQLRLYVMGRTDKSALAFTNLKTFCKSHLNGRRYRIKVVDLLRQPHLAKGHQILAVPTVVRQLPNPVRTLIGNFSRTADMLVGLDLRPTL
jgi:circadian clock protein KaiB